jgi:hypothetical protein
MRVDPTLIADVYLYALCVLAIAPLACVGWLSGQLEWLRGKPDQRLLVPDAGSGRAAYAIYFLWTWTAQHRLIADPATTRAVYLNRVFSIAAAVGWIMLFVLPRDFPERASAALAAV